MIKSKRYPAGLVNGIEAGKPANLKIGCDIIAGVATDRYNTAVRAMLEKTKIV
jgi:hypothetical protein